MATLYELVETMKNLEAIAAEGEIDDQCLQDTWESLEGEFEDKADAYAKVMRNLKGDIELLKKEEARLEARKKSLEKNIDRMMNQLLESMKECNKTKFKTAMFSFNVAKNPESVVIVNEDKVPKKFLIPQPAKINKTAIKEFINGGGKCTYAHLEQGESLRIK